MMTTYNNQSQVISTEDKKKNAFSMREYHKPVLEYLELSNSPFYPKLPYIKNGTQVVAMFESEMDSDQDIFIEYATKFNTPTDPARKLYRLRHNPHFREEYDCEPVGNGSTRYFVPTEELIEVTIKQKQALAAKQDDLQDIPFSEMSLRDHVAITLRIPCSKKRWLNDLVTANS